MKFLEKIVKSKKFKIALLLVIIFIGFSYSFAQTEVYRDLSEKLIIFLKALSIFWLIPAIIAGKLMTNDWVFGLGMDKYLWYMWNVMKNFANFFIGFMFFGIILYSFFKGSIGSIFKKYLLKIFLAGVLINLSWFIILVLLDISLILTYAVGDIPRVFLEKKMDDIKSSVEKVVKTDCGKVFVIDLETSKIEQVSKNNNIQCEPTSFVNKIFGDINDLSGPLVYMGYSVLGVLDWTNVAPDKITSFKDMAVDVLLKFILVILFILPLTVLAIVNFIRIFWIWMFIIFSPFVIINAVFGGSISKKVKIFEKFSFSNLIGLIFMPVAVVGTLSIGMIFIVTFQEFLLGGKDNTEELKNVGIYGSNTNSCLQISTDSQVCIKYGELFKKGLDYAGGIIGWLIMVFFIIFFLWSLLQVGFKASSITAGISDSIFNFAKKVGSALPVIPGGLSVGAIGEAQRKFNYDLFRSLQGSRGDKLADMVANFFGLEDRYLKPSEIEKLKGSIKYSSGEAKVYHFFKDLRGILSKKKGTISLKDDPNLQKIIKELLESLPSKFINSYGLSSLYKDPNKGGELRDDWLNNPELGRFLYFMMHNLPDSVEAFNPADIKAKMSKVNIVSNYDDSIFKVK